jgi:uncharacterized membrane-anchored protein
MSNARLLPAVNKRYWALVIAMTTLGETAGDLVSQTFGFGYGGGSVVLLLLFLGVAVVDLVASGRSLLRYWTALTLASIGGTTLSDWLSRSLALGYPRSFVLVAVVLAGALFAWRRLAGGADLQSSMSAGALGLYWGAILASSTLGTVLGDLLVDETPLGYVGATVALLVTLAIVAGLAVGTRTSRVLCYWLAIVVTHPLGATLGDSLTKVDGGLGLGNARATALLLAVIVVVVVVDAAVRHRRSAPAVPTDR